MSLGGTQQCYVFEGKIKREVIQKTDSLRWHLITPQNGKLHEGSQDLELLVLYYLPNAKFNTGTV